MSVVDRQRRRDAAPARPRGAGLLRRLLRHEVARFAAGGLLAALLVGAGAFAVVGRDAEAQAVGHARDITEVEGHGIIEPALTDAILRSDSMAVARIDNLVHRLILGNGVVRVKLWQANGTVLYSDEHALIGRHFGLDALEKQSLRTGQPDAGVSDLTDPENVYERSFGKLLQVYLPVHAPDGVPLLFETYQLYSAITQYQQQVWASFVPVLVGGLALLFLIQVPLAAVLARRLRASVAEREALLERAITASEKERRRIARDLHDGVVQRLAGVGFSLAALARRIGAADGRNGASAASDIEAAAMETRAAMRDLRTLIVEIAPPNLHAEGIDNALRDLLEPLAAAGVSVSLDATPPPPIGEATTTLLFRVAQEALRNAARHAGASHVGVSLTSSAEAVRLEVRDDGRGFSDADLERRRRDGHVGLSLLRDLVGDGGGDLQVESGASGTLVAVEMPL